MAISQWLKDQRDVHTKKASATLALDEMDFTLIRGDTSGGAVTLTLSPAEAKAAGQEFRVINTGGNNLTVTAAVGFGGSTAASFVLVRGQMATLYCDGSYWYYQHHEAAA